MLLSFYSCEDFVASSLIKIIQTLVDSFDLYWLFYGLEFCDINISLVIILPD